MVFHWSLSDCKSLQVTRILLSILANVNNVTVWMVSTRPLISKSSSSFIIIFFPCEFFIPALDGGLSLGSEWDQVYLGLQDSSQYSGLSLQGCSLDGLDFSSDFQFLHSFFQAFGTVPNAPITISISILLTCFSHQR